MPYTRPDVYFTETLLPSVAGAGSTIPSGAFVGLAAKGPSAPTLVKSWSQYVTLYGGFVSGYTSWLPYAVYQHFTNGGGDCYVVRVLPTGAEPSTLDLLDDAGSPLTTLTVSAKNPGTWGDSVHVQVIDRSASAGRFDLYVYNGGTTGSYIVERWNDLVMDPDSERYVESVINSVRRGSAWITVTDAGSATAHPDNAPKVLSPTALTGGSDGLVAAVAEVQNITVAASGGTWDLTIGAESALDLAYDISAADLEDVLDGFTAFSNGDIEVTGGPGNVSGSTPYVLTYLASLGNRVLPTCDSTNLTGGAHTATPSTVVPGVGASDNLLSANLTAVYSAAVTSLDAVDLPLILNIPPHNDPNGDPLSDAVFTSALSYATGRYDTFMVVDVPSPTLDPTGAVDYYEALTDTSYGALYYPWVVINNPASARSGVRITVPPGGAIVGQFMATDRLRGPEKTPAGLNNKISGALDLSVTMTVDDLDELAAGQVNALRPYGGSGICIMGGRTLLSTGNDRYLTIRRQLIFLRNGLINLTRFAVFEVNDHRLWETITNRVTTFLTDYWASQGLRGETPREAFFVKCDAENNTLARIEAGEVHVQVGVALQYPSEFVVIDLAQWEGGANTTEVV